MRFYQMDFSFQSLLSTSKWAEVPKRLLMALHCLSSASILSHLHQFLIYFLFARTPVFICVTVAALENLSREMLFPVSKGRIFAKIRISCNLSFILL